MVITHFGCFANGNSPLPVSTVLLFKPALTFRHFMFFPTLTKNVIRLVFCDASPTCLTFSFISTVHKHLQILTSCEAPCEAPAFHFQSQTSARLFFFPPFFWVPLAAAVIALLVLRVSLNRSNTCTSSWGREGRRGKGGWSIALALPWRNISSNMAVNLSRGQESAVHSVAVPTRCCCCLRLWFGALQRGATGRHPGAGSLAVIYEAPAQQGFLCFSHPNTPPPKNGGIQLALESRSISSHG